MYTVQYIQLVGPCMHSVHCTVYSASLTGCVCKVHTVQYFQLIRPVVYVLYSTIKGQDCSTEILYRSVGSFLRTIRQYDKMAGWPVKLAL